MTDDYTEAPAWALALIAGWELPDGYSLHWSGHNYERALHLIESRKYLIGGIQQREGEERWKYWREHPHCFGYAHSPEAALANMLELFNLSAWPKEDREE